jgi:hypothetical protein
MTGKRALQLCCHTVKTDDSSRSYPAVPVPSPVSCRSSCIAVETLLFIQTRNGRAVS